MHHHRLEHTWNNYMFTSVLQTSWHFTRNSTQYSATVRCTRRCSPSRLTHLTPALKMPRHTIDALGIHSRPRSCMLCMLSFTIHTFDHINRHEMPSIEVTASDNRCSPNKNLRTFRGGHVQGFSATNHTSHPSLPSL